MLSPAAKPDGILAVTDVDAHAMMCACAVTSLPGFQAKRGREIAAEVAKALGQAAAAGRAPPVVSLGDALSLGHGLLRAVGPADAAKLERAAWGDGGRGVVAERPLPKRLVAEESFPPTASLPALQVLFLF